MCLLFEILGNAFGPHGSVFLFHGIFPQSLHPPRSYPYGTDYSESKVREHHALKHDISAVHMPPANSGDRSQMFSPSKNKAGERWKRERSASRVPYA